MNQYKHTVICLMRSYCINPSVESRNAQTTVTVTHEALQGTSGPYGR